MVCELFIYANIKRKQTHLFIQKHGRGIPGWVGVIPGWVGCIISLQWRHNDHDNVSNHQPHGCLLNRLFMRSKENTKVPRHWPLCGEITGADEFPAQKASNAENVSIWWRHYV